MIMHLFSRKSPLKTLVNAVPSKNWAPYLLVHNEEIELLVGTVEYFDLLHLRGAWYDVYSRTFYRGRRSSHPSIELNLDYKIKSRDQINLSPENYLIAMGLLENDGVYIERKGMNILPAFAPISSRFYKNSLKYVKCVDKFGYFLDRCL